VHATQKSQPHFVSPLLNRQVGHLAGLSSFLGLA